MTTDNDHKAAEAGSADATTMQAIVQERYGGADVLELRDVAVPTPADDRVLVRVEAAALNIYDWHMITGTPAMVRTVAGFTKPKQQIPGADVAGVVVRVGDTVTGFEPGDEVFGDIGAGAFAEYAVAREKSLTRKPAAVGFREAAATPLAAITALQGLRDVGDLQSGQRVLINGASGGVGTFAVQIAKALGAEVTAVCSTAKVETARRIGADHVIDYTRDDFTSTEREYDVIFDNVGTRPWRQTSRVLKPGGVLVSVTGEKHAVMGPMRAILLRKVQSMFGDKRFTWFTASVKQADLETLAGWLEDGTVAPVIERTYPLEQMPDALRYLAEGHAHGKLVIDV